MKPSFLQILIAGLLVHAVTRLDAQEFLNLEIPSVKIENLPVSEALTKLSEIAVANDAKSQGFNGFAVRSEAGVIDNVSVSLDAISFGFAIDVFAKIAQMQYDVEDGVVTFEVRRDLTFEALYFSDLVKASLGLGEEFGPDEVRESLIAIGIRMPNESKILVSKDKNFAVVELSHEEANRLQSLVDLLNRGLKIQTR